MKSFFYKTKTRLRNFWNNWAHSTHRNMSQGAESIFRMMPWAKGDCWRRNDKRQHRS